MTRESLARRTYRLRRWLKWVRAGKPRDMPVVMREGTLEACVHDQGIIREWHWDTGYMNVWVDADIIWECYKTVYPVRRIEHNPGCTYCQVLAGSQS